MSVCHTAAPHLPPSSFSTAQGAVVRPRMARSAPSMPRFRGQPRGGLIESPERSLNRAYSDP